jgi:hypothetical protein
MHVIDGPLFGEPYDLDVWGGVEGEHPEHTVARWQAAVCKTMRLGYWSWVALQLDRARYYTCPTLMFDDYVCPPETSGDGDDDALARTTWHFAQDLTTACNAVFREFPGNHAVLVELKRAGVLTGDADPDAEHSCLYVDFGTECAARAFIHALNAYCADWYKEHFG